MAMENPDIEKVTAAHDIARDLAEIRVHALSAFDIALDPGWKKTGSLNREAAWWVVYEGSVSVRLQGMRDRIPVGPGDMFFMPVPVSGQIAVDGSEPVGAVTVHFYPAIMGSWRRFGRLGFPNLYPAHPDAPWSSVSTYLADLCSTPRPPSWRTEASHLIRGAQVPADNGSQLQGNRRALRLLGRGILLPYLQAYHGDDAFRLSSDFGRVAGCVELVELRLWQRCSDAGCRMPASYSPKPGCRLSTARLANCPSRALSSSAIGCGSKRRR